MSGAKMNTKASFAGEYIELDDRALIGQLVPALSAGVHAAAKTPLTAVGRFMAVPVFHDVAGIRVCRAAG
jgi:hypothetical protein